MEPALLQGSPQSVPAVLCSCSDMPRIEANLVSAPLGNRGNFSKPSLAWLLQFWVDHFAEGPVRAEPHVQHGEKGILAGKRGHEDFFTLRFVTLSKGLPQMEKVYPVGDPYGRFARKALTLDRKEAIGRCPVQRYNLPIPNLCQRSKIDNAADFLPHILPSDISAKDRLLVLSRFHSRILPAENCF